MNNPFTRLMVRQIIENEGYACPEICSPEELIGDRHMRDPIVEEVRKHRMEHTRKFQGDLRAICADLRFIQETAGLEVVRLPARKIAPKSAGTRKRTKR